METHEPIPVAKPTSVYEEHAGSNIHAGMTNLLILILSLQEIVMELFTDEDNEDPPMGSTENLLAPGRSL